jgi:hypothetical protein
MVIRCGVLLHCTMHVNIKCIPIYHCRGSLVMLVEVLEMEEQKLRHLLGKFMIQLNDK